MEKDRNKGERVEGGNAGLQHQIHKMMSWRRAYSTGDVITGVRDAIHFPQ